MKDKTRDEIIVAWTIQLSIIAGFIIGRWYEHRIYVEAMFDEITKLIN